MVRSNILERMLSEQLMDILNCYRDNNKQRRKRKQEMEDRKEEIAKRKQEFPFPISYFPMSISEYYSYYEK